MINSVVSAWGCSQQQFCCGSAWRLMKVKRLPHWCLCRLHPRRNMLPFFHSFIHSFKYESSNLQRPSESFLPRSACHFVVTYLAATALIPAGGPSQSGWQFSRGCVDASRHACSVIASALHQSSGAAQRRLAASQPVSWKSSCKKWLRKVFPVLRCANLSPAWNEMKWNLCPLAGNWQPSLLRLRSNCDLTAQQLDVKELIRGRVKTQSYQCCSFCLLTLESLLDIKETRSEEMLAKGGQLKNIFKVI